MTEVEKKGIATHVKKLRNDSYSFILAGEGGKYHVISKDRVDEGNLAVINGVESNGSIFAKSVSSRFINEDEIREMFKKAEESVHLNDIKPLVDDPVMDELWPHIKDMAKKIHVASMFNRQTIMRFHGDADGVTSAICISSIISARRIQQNLVTYTPRDALGDIAVLKDTFMPLVIFVDFGSGEESIPGIELIRAAGIDLYIIDHHPPSNKVKELSFAINPWFISNNPEVSKFTAGYLSYEIARLLGHDNRWILGASISGDKSNILPIDERDKNNALVIDYLTTFSAYGNNIDFYTSVLNDRDLYNTILNQAKESLELVRLQAEKLAKVKRIGELEIYTLSVDRVVKKTDFPSRGKIASQLYEVVKHKNALVLAYSDYGLIFRVTDGAFSKGIKANEIISKLKDLYPNIIVGGGGHSKAASIRFLKGNQQFIMEEVMRIVRSIMESSP